MATTAPRGGTYTFDSSLPLPHQLFRDTTTTVLYHGSTFYVGVASSHTPHYGISSCHHEDPLWSAQLNPCPLLNLIRMPLFFYIPIDRAMHYSKYSSLDEFIISQWICYFWHFISKQFFLFLRIESHFNTHPNRRIFLEYSLLWRIIEVLFIIAVDMEVSTGSFEACLHNIRMYRTASCSLATRAPPTKAETFLSERTWYETFDADYMVKQVAIRRGWRDARVV